MQLRRYDDAAAFLRHAGAFLVADEAVHSLILGIAATLSADPERFGQSPYLAAVERDGEVAAAAVMTPPRPVLLSLADPAALAPIADDLHARFGTLAGVNAPSAVSRAFAEEWQRRAGGSYRRATAMRIYELTAVIPPTAVPGQLRRATEGDRDLLVAWTAAFIAETGIANDDARRIVDHRLHDPASALYLWEDGHPVAMAGQFGPTPHGTRVNAVYTPPEYRRRGYASACVAALSQRLLDEGFLFCSLYTNLANPTANRIYQAIGYQPVCDADDYTFLPAAL